MCGARMPLRPRAGPGRARQPPEAGGSEAGPQHTQVWHCTGRGNASILSRSRSDDARWCQRLEAPEGAVFSRKSPFENTSEGDEQEQKAVQRLVWGKKFR